MDKSVLLIGNFLSLARTYGSVGEELACRLSDAGWTVSMASDKVGRVLRLADMLRTAWSRRRHYQVAHVDVFSGPAFLWAEWVCWTLRRLGKPYVLTLRGGDLPPFSARQPHRVRRLLGSAQRVTSPSPYLQQQMKRYRDEIQLMPNPIEINQYPFRARSRPAPKLVWLRAFHQMYNPTMVPHVLAQLQDHYFDVHALMIGPDKGDGSLQATQKLAANLGVAGRLSFPGAVPKADVPRWLAMGDVFLNTTNIDNTPVSVQEAMACGLCVVSTDVGGLPYLLQNGETGLLVPSDNPPAMAQAIRKILADPDLATRLSNAARQKVERFDWSVILPQWERMFEELGELAPHTSARRAPSTCANASESHT